jgi:MFS transporter, FHS family, L-fucose permease
LNVTPADKTVARPVDAGRSPYRGALCVLSSLFFIWGFITSLNDILIPHLKAMFTLNYTQAMLVQFCFFAAYFVMSVPSGYLVDRIHYKAGIIAGLAIAGSGCLLFYPAASLRSYGLFLTAFFVLASGITLLQVAANPYVTTLGAAGSASGRLTLTQAFNSLGTTLGPILGSVLILSQPLKTPDELRILNAAALASYQTSEAASVQMPYLGLAIVLVGLATLFAMLRLPRIDFHRHSDLALGYEDLGSAWKYPRLLLGTLAIFTYVGGEVAIGSFLVNFLAEPTIAAMAAPTAGKYVSLYWGGAMLGRFAGAVILRRVQPATALAYAAVCAILLISITVAGSGRLAMWSILAVGLFNSIMFPTIFSLALDGLGRYTGQGAGILCTAIVGGAIIPVVQGVLADHFGIRCAFLVPLLCYGYIVYFAYRCRAHVSLANHVDT